MEYQITDTDKERAYLVGVEVKGARPLLSVDESLAELALLADTAGLDIVGQTTQRLSRIDPKTFIGSGKLEEVRGELEQHGAQTLLIDDELSPRHQREIENALENKVKVLDRSALILDIFAQHAQTHEGRLQVELAQYEYLLPRLTRQWTHLERQAGGGGGRSGNGGVGLRGPGEKQLEVDRQEIRRIIGRLKDELEQVRAHRERHRSQRIKAEIPLVAMVGYTNAGKSTLMNALTNADVYVANQLFATLDPTTRKISLPSSKEALLSDTVGFIQKLPTTLIAAFRATLEEINEASVILHVVDSAHPNALQHIDTVEDTLAQLDIPRIPQILALNKCDQWGDEDLTPQFTDLGYDAVVKVSARKRFGLETLLQTIENVLRREMVAINCLLPYSQGELISLAHRHGIIDAETHENEGVRLQGVVPAALAARLTREGR